MNFKDYESKRKALMDESERLIDEGKIDEAEAKMKEVIALDEKWDAICVAEANKAALEGKARKQNVSNPGKPTTEGEVLDSTGKKESVEIADLYKTEEYATAWTKKMMGKPLTTDEESRYRMVNEYVHTTGNTGDVIPETVASGIWSEIEGLYPYYADVTKTYVSGLLTIVQSGTSTDAAWYEEENSTEDGEEKFATYTLAGCELSRAITVSWKLKEMAMEDFIRYIQRRLAEKMGAALGYGMTCGAGKADNAAPEPLGVVTAIKQDGGQAVTYTKGSMGYAHITAARAKIKSGYSNRLAIYANTATIWGELANVKDDNGRPIFVSDPTAGGVYKVLGLDVKEDSSLADGDVLFSNASAGYQANINKQLSVVTEDHAKARTTDYVGYAIADGAPLTLNAHALLTPGE